MQTRKLGKSELHLTTIGHGTWSIGGPWEFGWGPQDDKESLATIRRALELGINWIDTAPAYGLGHSEEIVGQAIKGHRDRLVIATKCGLVWDDPSQGKVDNRLKTWSVKQEAEESLRRLDIDVIDLYQIHWPVPDEDIEEGWEAIAELIDEGKVRYGGVSNFSVEQMKRIQPIHPITSLQPEYSMLAREPEEGLLPFCRENNIGVVAYSPLRSGVLTAKFDRERVENLADGDWRRRDRDFQEPRLSANLDLLDELRDVARRHGRPVHQLATAWVLAQPGITSAIVGARTVEQIEGSAPAGEWNLSEGILDEIRSLLHGHKQKVEMLGG